MNIKDLTQIEGFSFDIIAGKSGTANKIKNDVVYFPELLVVGFAVSNGKDSVQVLSYDVLNYTKENTKLLRNLTKNNPPCIIIPHDVTPPKVLLQICDQSKIPLLVSHLTLRDTRNRLEYLLERELAPTTIVYGTLIDVYGMGVLLKGPSGIGKTECALDLIFRGHRLVADDVVRIIKKKEGRIEGEGVEKSKNLKYHIEIRGIGILSLRDIFGIRGVRERKGVELVVSLYEGRSKIPSEISGIESKTCKILDVELPEICIPLVPGKHISPLIEVITLDKLLKLSGIDSAKKFDKELIRLMRDIKKDKGRIRGKDIDK
jgi:HPr kinase/phosphorylase